MTDITYERAVEHRREAVEALAKLQDFRSKDGSWRASEVIGVATVHALLAVEARLDELSEYVGELR